MNNIKYDWNDILIIPSETSTINSRTEINIYNNNKLPLFVSPMDTVVDTNNAQKFLDLGFEVCLPRNIDYTKDLDDCFFSYGLDEIITINNNSDDLPQKVLIDIANGHLSKLENTVIKIKKNYPDIILMVGNIANPKTYEKLSKAGADIIRCGIGNGSGCLTTKNVGIGYPLASLIKECYDIKKLKKLKSKIIADGGFKEYSDIIKALGIGADAVMLGGILNKCLESCSETFIYSDNCYKQIDNNIAYDSFKNKGNIYKYFRGMSTKEVQKDWGKKKLKTSEGIVKYNKVEYTISGWVENFTDYLKSNMSYSNKKNIKDYCGKADLIFISSESYKRFNK